MWGCVGVCGYVGVCGLCVGVCVGVCVHSLCEQRALVLQVCVLSVLSKCQCCVGAVVMVPFCVLLLLHARLL